MVTGAGKAETIGFEGLDRNPEGIAHAAVLLMGSAGGFDLKSAPRTCRRSKPGSPPRGTSTATAMWTSRSRTHRGAEISRRAPLSTGGGTQGFSAARRSELPTLGATGVAAGDLNQDGFADLVFSNANDGRTHDVPSYIYWGSAEGFAPLSAGRRARPSGAASVNVADLNADGKQKDLLVVNQYSGEIEGECIQRPSSGATRHSYYSFGFDGRSFQVSVSYDTTVADFNDDGFVDFVF